MADYLLLENGDNLLLESGDLFLLESSGATPSATGRALWDTGYTMFIEAAFSAQTGDSGVWDDGLWDTATWGPDVIWSDITSVVFAWDSRLGRSSEAAHVSAATGNVVVDNHEGDFTPENLSGPYVSAGVSGVRPGRPIRGYVTSSSGVRYPLFYGFIEDFPEDLNSLAPTITFTWVDDLAVLAAIDGYEQTAVGSGELVGYRMHRILDNAEWDGDRNIDLGTTTLQPTTLAQNALTEVFLTADSDGGDVWVEPSSTGPGRSLVFQDREAPLRNTRSNTVQWTFTDVDSAGALHYESIRFESGMSSLVNQVALARAGGSVVTETDLASRALYGLKRWGRNDLVCETDTQVSTVAQLVLQRRADPTRRPRAITLRPRIYSDLWDVVLGARRWDRVSVTRTTVSGTTITHQCFIDGIEHSVSDGDWVTTLRLSSATGFPSASEFGVWDTSEWDETYWAPAS